MKEICDVEYEYELIIHYCDNNICLQWYEIKIDYCYFIQIAYVDNYSFFLNHLNQIQYVKQRKSNNHKTSTK